MQQDKYVAINWQRLPFNLYGRKTTWWLCLFIFRRTMGPLHAVLSLSQSGPTSVDHHMFHHKPLYISPSLLCIHLNKTFTIYTSHFLLVLKISIVLTLLSFLPPMGAQSIFSRKQRRFWSWQRCSRYIQEQRTRLYIIWKCSILLLQCNDLWNLELWRII